MPNPFITHSNITTMRIETILNTLTKKDYDNCPNIEKLVKSSVINNSKINYNLCDHPIKWRSPKIKIEKIDLH